MWLPSYGRATTWVNDEWFQGLMHESNRLRIKTVHFNNEHGEISQATGACLGDFSLPAPSAGGRARKQQWV